MFFFKKFLQLFLTLGFIVIFVQNCTQQEKIQLFTPPLSDNAFLAQLSLSHGTLNENFAFFKYRYSASLPYESETIQFNIIAEDPNATWVIKKDGIVLNNPVQLQTGLNQFEILVSAPDKTTFCTYYLDITRDTEVTNPSQNANLSLLEIKDYFISPSFDPMITDYTLNVPYTTTSLILSYLSENDLAQITLDGDPANLSMGNNNLTITVTAPAGNTKIYKITVNRANAILSNNADLASLSLAEASLSPLFSPAILNYHTTVSYETTSLNIITQTAASTASFQITGPLHNLSPGENIIFLTVTAEAGNQKVYQITATRQSPPLSSNADLASLTLSSGILSPFFTPATTSYTATVETGITSVQINAVTADSNASISYPAAPQLLLGENNFTITITAPAGNQKVYHLKIFRENPPLSKDSTLKSLTLSSGTLTPDFIPSTTHYNVSAESNLESISFTAEVNHPGATLMLNGIALSSGTPSASQPLSTGSNIFTFTITAEDGSENNYTVQVNKTANPLYQLSNFTNINDTSEGIAFDNQGNLYVTAYNQGKVLKVSSSGTLSPFLSNLSGPAGLAPIPNGGFFLCEFGSKKVHKLSAQGTILNSYTSISTFKSFSQPNAVAVNSVGTAYVSDTSGFMAYIKSDGTKGILKSFTGEYPNGLTIIEEGANDIVYVNVNNSSLKGKIYKLTVSRSTATVSSSVTLSLSGDTPLNLADGITHDSQGRLWISHSTYTGNSFTGYKVNTSYLSKLTLSSGELKHVYSSSSDLKGPANIAFGQGSGFDPKSLYLTQMEDVGTSSTTISKWIKVMNVLE